MTYNINDNIGYTSIVTYHKKQYKSVVVSGTGRMLLTTGFNSEFDYRTQLDTGLRVKASNQGVTHLSARQVWRGEYGTFSKERWDRATNVHGKVYPRESVLKDNVTYTITWVPSNKTRISLTITALDECRVFLLVSDSMTKHGVDVFLNNQEVQNIIQEYLHTVHGRQEYRFFYDIEIHNKDDISRYITWVNEHDFIPTSYFMDNHTPDYLINKLRIEANNEGDVFQPTRTLTVRDHWEYCNYRYNKAAYVWKNTVDIGYSDQLKALNENKWAIFSR